MTDPFSFSPTTDTTSSTATATETSTATTTNSSNKRPRPSTTLESECVVVVSGIAKWWTPNHLSEFLSYGLQERDLLQYRGNPVTSCKILPVLPARDQDHYQTATAAAAAAAAATTTTTAHVKLRSFQEMRNLLSLDGQEFNGVRLRLGPWKKNPTSSNNNNNNDHDKDDEEYHRRNTRRRREEAEKERTTAARENQRQSQSQSRSSARKENIQIYLVHEYDSLANPQQLKKFLNQEMSKLGLGPSLSSSSLSSTPSSSLSNALSNALSNDDGVDDSIVICTKRSWNTYLLEAADANVATRLLNLNYFPLAQGSILRLRRPGEYSGPPPKFKSYHHFIRQHQDDQVRNKKKSPTSTFTAAGTDTTAAGTGDASDGNYYGPTSGSDNKALSASKQTAASSSSSSSSAVAVAVAPGSCWVFLAKSSVNREEGMDVPEIINFFNMVLYKERLSNDNKRAITGYRERSPNWFRLHTATPELAYNLCHLDGIYFQLVALHVKRARGHDEPRTRSWNEYYLQRHGCNDPDIACQVYTTHSMPSLRQPKSLVAFLNEKMRQLGLFIPSTSDKYSGSGQMDAIRDCRPLANNTYVLRAATPDLAEALVYLNEMPLQPPPRQQSPSESHPQLDIRLHRNRAYQGPRPKYSNYDDFRKHYNADSHIVCKVYVYDPPAKVFPAEVVEFLNHQMKVYKLCSTDQQQQQQQLQGATTIVGWKMLRPPSHTIALDVANEGLAERLVYLNEIECKGSRLSLRRHNKYNGPAPKFQNIAEFLQHNTDGTANSSNIIPSIKTVASARESKESQAAALDSKGANKNSRDISISISKSKSVSKEAAPPSIQEKPSEASLSKDDKATQSSVDILFQKQEMVLLEEAASWKMENKRLKRELAQLARDDVRLKQQTERVSDENGQFRAKHQGMEHGSKKNPVDLDLDSEAFAEVEKAKTESQEAKKETVELKNQLISVINKLATTQQQLSDVHNSWQAQQQQLVRHESKIDDLSRKLEDTETRFRAVTQSLTLQTNELADERGSRRKLEAGLLMERRQSKEMKKSLRALQSIKAEEEDEYDI